MTITTKVIAHSRWDSVPDLITLELRYPRFIHAEFMTHRVFSRGASSSRAVPIERMIQDVIDDPAMPVAWGSNKPGMQAGEELDHFAKNACISQWMASRDFAVERVKVMAAEGVHKQIANRLLEPFGHISVVCTSTEWDNFFDLRCHPDADPTMRALAEAMRDAINGSEPEVTKWHLPYVNKSDYGGGSYEDVPYDGRSILAAISAARCARVSYLNHDGSEPDIEKDMGLAMRLLESKHMSPFEHQARIGDDTPLWANFTGWEQYRKLIERESA